MHCNNRVISPRTLVPENQKLCPVESWDDSWVPESLMQGAACSRPWTRDVLPTVLEGASVAVG